VSEQKVVAEFVRTIFDGKNNPRKNGIGDGGNDQAEKPGRFAAQALRRAVGDLTQLQGQRLDARAGFIGNVRRVAQRLGNRHHGDIGLLGDVFEANHVFRILKAEG
jgi:hypothetical protein